MHKFIGGLSIIMALFMTGCATSKQSVDYMELIRARLKQNVSTKEDVKALLGKPQSKTITDFSASNMPQLPYVDTASIMPYEMWTYSWVRTVIDKEPGKTFPLLGTMSQSVQTVVVNFDRDGKMTGFTTSENSL